MGFLSMVQLRCEDWGLSVEGNEGTAMGDRLDKIDFLQGCQQETPVSTGNWR